MGPSRSRRGERVEHGGFDAIAELRFDGSFTGSDRRDHACRTIDMSAEIVALRSDYRPTIGERVELRLEQWGRFDGTVIRRFDGGFTIGLEVADRPRAHVAMQFAWLARRFSSREARLHERLRPQRRFTTFTVARVTLPCEIVDLSRSGAALRTSVKAPVGARLTLGEKTPAEVTRETADGFAVRFLRILPLAAFDEDIEL